MEKQRRKTGSKASATDVGRKATWPRTLWTDAKNADKQPNGYEVPKITATGTSKESKELQLADLTPKTIMKKMTLLFAKKQKNANKGNQED